MGKTHFEAGILYYIIFSYLLGKYILLASFENITFYGAAVAGIAALLPDIDSNRSMINKYNPVVNKANKVLSKIMNGLSILFRLVFMTGGGIAIIYYKDVLVELMGGVDLFKGYEENIVYGVAIFLIVLGLGDRNIISYIPVIGTISRNITEFVNEIFKTLQRWLIIICYLIIAIYVIRYNHLHWNDRVVDIIAILPVITIFFPHRTITHSVEGAVIFIWGANYIFSKFDRKDLVFAFAIGYLSHLYFTDMLTKEGIPLSIIPRLIKKTCLYKRIKKNRVLYFFYRILDTRLSLRLMSTGTKTGNIFETFYIIIIAAVAGSLAFLL